MASPGCAAASRCPTRPRPSAPMSISRDPPGAAPASPHCRLTPPAVAARPPLFFLHEAIMITEQLSQALSIAAAELDPVSQGAATVTSGGVDMSKFERVMFV